MAGKTRFPRDPEGLELHQEPVEPVRGLPEAGGSPELQATMVEANTINPVVITTVRFKIYSFKSYTRYGLATFEPEGF